MIGKEIAALVRKAIKKAQRKNELPKFEIPEVLVERPRDAGHGDFATPVCLQLARWARMAPMEIAQRVVKRLAETDYVGQVEVAHPGFINFTLDTGWLARQVEAILAAGERYGNVDIGQGKRAQVEFVSANPTGPLHVGAGRNAVLGDSLANVLEAAGYRVQREYYVNDRGTQVENFAATVYARYVQALGHDEPLPEDGYQGAYVVELGKQIAEEKGGRFLSMDRAEATRQVGEMGLERTVASIRDDLAMLGVRFDRWFSERSLYDEGLFGQVMSLLRQQNYIAEKDGAVWFTTTDLGESKDNVLIRSDGTPGYFASDVAYHYDKFVQRGFDWVIDVWAADHQGHVPRMKAMMTALGLDPERLTLLIYQLVTLRRGGEIVRLSKRTGDIITLREVVDEVGPDAVRFFLLARSADSQMDFDLELAKEQSNENPVYYVQYGHARIASILRFAEDRGATPDGGDVSLLTHPAELALIRQMLLLPELVELSACALSPHHLTYYAQDLASAFHSFYTECRVVSTELGDEEITKARLRLALAAKMVLARVLHLMGMNAPDRM